MGSHEKPLVQQAVLPHCAAALAADAGRSQFVGRVFHQIRTPRNIAARRRQAAARILDQRTGHKIRSDLCRLDLLDKLAIAVVHHDDGMRIGCAHGFADLPDLRAGQRLAHCVPAAALDKHQLDVVILRRLGDRGQVRHSVLQIDLLITDAVALHAAAVVAGDCILQRVVRRTCD